MTTSNPSQSAYAQAGVSIDAGQAAVEGFKAAVKRSHNSNVLAGVGAFGGLFALNDLPDNATLVASTDGVGTKVKLAAQYAEQAQSLENIGHDIVNHCINDILCAGSGVKPLIFLDYVASSKLEPNHVARLVTGIADACTAVGCALIGGETAEMPGVYHDGAFDVVGTIIGVMDSQQQYPRATSKDEDKIQAGDTLIALPSSGAHTNGYSLIRKVLEGTELEQDIAGIGNLREALLQPHRCYYHELQQLEQANLFPKSLAHITGGGLIENLPRAIPADCSASVDVSAWQPPALFRFIQEKGNIDPREMYRIFNMGVGLVMVMAAADAEETLALLPEAFTIGHIRSADETADAQALILENL